MHRDEAIAHAERLLRRSLMLDALRYGEFTLASGATSGYYFDGRLLTTDGESVEIITDLFVDILMRRDIHRFGGPAVAAVPIIGAMALSAFAKQYDIKGYFVRPEQKQHGMGKQLEGHISPGDRVAIWDDTISTGGSLLDAVDAVDRLASKHRDGMLHSRPCAGWKRPPKRTFHPALQHPGQQPSWSCRSRQRIVGELV